MVRRVWLLLAALFLPMLLSGCSLLSYEDLYSLPQAPEDYYDLQDVLTEVLDAGYSYLSPSGGLRREPVQLTDLDGDGADEAVAFFRSSDGAVTLYIFSRDGDVYSPAAELDGVGSAVAQVEYADLNGSGSQEIILTCQVSESVTQALQVYQYDGTDAACVLSAACDQYVMADLDGDGRQEILCLTGSGSDSMAAAECYSWNEGAFQRIGEQRLRLAYDDIRQIQEGYITEDVQAVLLSGVSSEGLLLTDVLGASDGALMMIAPETDILTSSPAYSYYVYPEDLDGDGILEIARTRQLPAADSGSTAQWVEDWYGISPDGTAQKRMTTYQNFAENWYLILPDVWDGHLSVKAGETSTTVSPVTFFHMPEEGTPQEILTIYTIQGDSRQSYVEENNLTMLLSTSDTIYAVALADAEIWEGTVSLAQVSEMFHYTRIT